MTTSERSLFDLLFEREIFNAECRAREDDELMAAGARGEPFWGVDKPADTVISGIAAWLPTDGRGYVGIGEELDRQILRGERFDPWMRWGHDPGDEDRS